MRTIIIIKQKAQSNIQSFDASKTYFLHYRTQVKAFSLPKKHIYNPVSLIFQSIRVLPHCFQLMAIKVRSIAAEHGLLLDENKP